MKTLIFVLVAAGCMAAPVFADEISLVAEGIQRLEAGDFEGALAKFTDAQIENPESPEIHFNMGMALTRLKRLEEAERAFGNALYSRSREIEKKAAFQLANLAVHGGKYKEALDLYDRALAIDAGYDDARVNREWTRRKILEMARKQKEQEDAQRREREVIEKLTELIKAQTQAHASVRMARRFLGEEPSPSRVLELEEVLNGAIPDGVPSPFDAEGAEEAAKQELKTAQTAIQDGMTALIEEVRKRLEPPEADPAAPPQPDAERDKLEKALPHLDASVPHLQAARDAWSKPAPWVAADEAQESALLSMLKALRELEDELTRIINDEVQILKDTLILKVRAEEPDDGGHLRPMDERVIDRDGMAGRQDTLGARLAAFTQGFEEHLKQMQATEADPNDPAGGQGVRPGEDPAAERQRMESALTHMHAAGDHMKAASPLLQSRSFEAAVEPERKAIEELLKARELLQPPGQGGDQGEQQKQEEPQQQQGEQSKDGEKPEDGQQGDPEDAGDDKQGEQDAKDGENKEKLSEEQAKKMLERARQRERDRRKAESEEALKQGAGSGRARGRDW